MNGRARAAVLGMLSASMCGVPALSQELPWEEFTDLISGEVCGIINTSGLELVALRSSGQLMAIGQDGEDIADFILPGVIVDLNSTDQAGGFPVFADGEFAGIIAFEDDAEGVSGLWWGFADAPEDPLLIASYDLATDIINRTNDIPADFVDVPCDACALWDDPDACVAPPPPVVNPPRITFNFCGAGGTATMALTFSGLLATSLARRRRILSTTTVREWPSSD